MFVITMETENFSWLAAGETEEEARAALRATWDVHLEQYGRHDNPNGLRSDEIEEQYEPIVHELSPGEGIRDHDKILTAKEA